MLVFDFAKCAATRCWSRGRLIGAVLLGLTVLPLHGRSDETDATGRALYETHCVRCHGAQGEGVADAYAEPLQGAHTVADLVRIIDETMPEDDPDQCTGPAARKVAEYIYRSFYAPQAEALQAQARVELARLTVRQYDQVIADLLGTFLGEARLDDQRGLKARYYNARGFARDKLVWERTDPQVALTFADQSPDAEKFGVEEFAIQWQGGVIAEETGDYEFCVTSENGVKLWVNGPQTPVIDAWVVSGEETEHRATVRLLGGRVYPLRLDFAKSKQKTASVSLKWRPPHKAEQVIPQRSLWPNWVPPTYVVTTPFPPDDSSVGYERGTTISRAWDQAKTFAAMEVAAVVEAHLRSADKFKKDAPDRVEQVKQFCHRFTERAFRRPLDEQQRAFFVEQHFAAEPDPVLAAKKVVLLVLMSPRFLYLGIGRDAADDYETASRMSFALWDSLPDAALLEAAGKGQLRTTEQVQRHARRMLADVRTQAKLQYFFHSWLNIDHLEDIAKDGERFPDFDALVASDLRTSLDLFVHDVVWSERSDLRELLLADYWYVNRRLADVYQVEAEVGNDFQKVTQDAQLRAGILTHPYVMARYAYHKATSPIHRGVFVVRSLLGRFLKPPPIAVAPADPGVNPDLTTRQRVALQTGEPACQTCHSMINALGFSFENYDAVGRFRTDENGTPIDASGSYKDLAGQLIEFQGARDLAVFLAASEETHRCFVEQLFHHVVKQPAGAYGPETLSELQKSFAESDFNVQNLLVEIVKVSAVGTTVE